MSLRSSSHATIFSTVSFVSSSSMMVPADFCGGSLKLPHSTCERQAEYGYDTVEIQLPAVISVGDAINEPRYPSLKAIMGAKKKPVDKVTIGDVGLQADQVGEAGSKARWTSATAPPQKAAGEIIEDEDTNETVERIVAWLDERKLL